MPITVRNRRDEPFVVADEAGHNDLEVIEGRHRVTACKRAGIKLLTGVVVKKDTDKLKLILIGCGQNLSHEDTVHMSLGDYLEAMGGIHIYHQAINPNKDDYINCKNLGVQHLLFKELQGKKKGVVAGAEEQTVEKQPKKTKGTKGKRHISKSGYGHYHKLATVPQEAFDMIVADQAPPEEQAFTYEKMYVDGKSRKFCGFSGEVDPDAWLTYLNMLVHHFEEHQRPATGPEAQYILVTLKWCETVVDEVLPELVLEDGEKLGDNEEELERFTELVWDGKWDHMNHAKMEKAVKGIAEDLEDEEDTQFKLMGGGSLVNWHTLPISALLQNNAGRFDIMFLRMDSDDRDWFSALARTVQLAKPDSAVLIALYMKLKLKFDLLYPWTTRGAWYWVNSSSFSRKVIKEDMLECATPILVAVNSDTLSYKSSHRAHIGDLYRSNFVVIPRTYALELENNLGNLEALAYGDNLSGIAACMYGGTKCYATTGSAELLASLQEKKTKFVETGKLTKELLGVTEAAALKEGHSLTAAEYAQEQMEKKAAKKAAVDVPERVPHKGGKALKGGKGVELDVVNVDSGMESMNAEVMVRKKTRLLAILIGGMRIGKIVLISSTSYNPPTLPATDLEKQSRKSTSTLAKTKQSAPKATGGEGGDDSSGGVDTAWEDLKAKVLPTRSTAKKAKDALAKQK
ncbi:hypothetical protein HK104_002704 [Borealophlyctis nickersoniae]|nr:hypothetical protein HK104_002704 [Borealophlyctis nickersoniae]